MVPVRITVTLGARTLPVEKVSDLRIATAFATAGQDIAKRLGAVKCPEHAKTATNVRIHFDSKGNADLQYDSCCEKLGAKIGEALG
jgi:hypothetical protein